MLRVVFTVLLGLGLWTVFGNRVTADDEQVQKVRRQRAVKAENKTVKIEIKRVKRDADGPRERNERKTRERTPNQREAAIKKLRAYLEKLKSLQRKLEKSGDAEARERNALQIRLTAAKLEDLQAASRKERSRRKEQGGERDVRERTLKQREASIKELRTYLEKLKDQQRKFEKSENVEARKKIAIQIRLTSAKLEDLQSVSRKQTVVRKKQRVERGAHPKIRAAGNKLEHMRAAIKHLKEAGLRELAQAVGQRAEKLQATIHRSEAVGQTGNDRRRDQDVVRKGERPQRDRVREEVRRDVQRERSSRRDGAENHEREFDQAILQIRRELEELRKEVRQLRGERGKKRDDSDNREE